MVLGALVDAGCELGALEAALASLGVEGWRLEARAVERGGLRGTHLVVRTDPARRFHTLGDMLRPIDALEPAGRRQDARGVRAPAAGRGRGARAPGPGRRGALPRGGRPRHARRRGGGGGRPRCARRGPGARLAAPDRRRHRADGARAAPGPRARDRRAPARVPGVRQRHRRGAGHADGRGDPHDARDACPPAGHDPRADRLGGRGRGSCRCRTSCGCWWAQTAPGDSEPGDVETLVSVETTIDDMSPQLYEPLVERLLAAGALDVYLTPVVMKRSRPGTVLTALAPPELADRLADMLFRETTTIGVRWSEVRRRRLPRELVRLPTSLGPVTFKVSTLGGRVGHGDPGVRGGAPDRRRAGPAGPRGAGDGAPGGAPGDRGGRGRRATRGTDGPPPAGEREERRMTGFPGWRCRSSPW